MEEEQKNNVEDCDSISIGTDGKGGKLKVYFNANDVEAAKKKIDNAAEIKRYANAKIMVNI